MSAIAIPVTNTHLDHFVAWARYLVGLGHNFVGQLDDAPGGSATTCLRATTRLHERSGTLASAMQIVGGTGGARNRFPTSGFDRVGQWAQGRGEAAHS
jgi:hypothetical protein